LRKTKVCKILIADAKGRKLLERILDLPPQTEKIADFKRRVLDLADDTDCERVISYIPKGSEHSKADCYSIEVASFNGGHVIAEVTWDMSRVLLRAFGEPEVKYQEEF